MNIVLNKTRIHASIEKVFALTTTAQYWPEWHPSCIRVTGKIDAPYQAGDEIHQEAKIVGKTRQGTWIVTEHIPLQRVALEMEEGRLQIRYTFVPLNGAIQVIRRLTYPTPQNMGGFSAADLEKMMHDESELGMQQLKVLIERGNL